MIYKKSTRGKIYHSDLYLNVESDPDFQMDLAISQFML